MPQDQDKSSCTKCGKEIVYFASSKGWYHAPFMTYYCKVRPNVYSQDNNEFNRATPPDAHEH